MAATSVIEQLNLQIKILELRIKELVETPTFEAQLLLQVKGVVVISALTYILTPVDPSRFS